MEDTLSDTEDTLGGSNIELTEELKKRVEENRKNALALKRKRQEVMRR